MKTVTPELDALLRSSRQFFMADLYTITLKSGSILRYTSYDVDVVLSGQTYAHDGPLFKRESTRTVVGIEVNEMRVTINPKTTDLLNGVRFIRACRVGALDGATLEIHKAFMPDRGGVSVGAVLMFGGRVSEMMFSRTEADVTVKSDTELLNISLPRNVCQPTCLNSLFDSGCGLSKSAFQAIGALQAGSTQTKFNVGLSGFPDGWFTVGTILFTTGANAGVMVSIKSFAAGVVYPSIPMLGAVATGDEFVIVPGCDRRQLTCGCSVLSVFTATPSIDTLNSEAHPYVDGDRVVLSNSGGALPVGLVAGFVYYIINADTDAFQLSLTYGGGAINITSAGTGTHRARAIGKFDNLPRFRGFPYVPIPETAL